MPGRFRTASRPSSTVIERASYDKWELHPARSRARHPPCRQCARTPYSSWEFGMTRAFLAVRVAVSPASWHPPSATLPRAGRPLTLTRRTVPSPSSELSLRTSIDASSLTCVAHAVESAAIDELAVGEAVRAGVGGEVGPDDLGPVTEHRTHRRMFLPALIRQQAADRGRQRLGVVPAGPARAGRRVIRRPFGIRIAAWPAAPGRPAAGHSPRARASAITSASAAAARRSRSARGTRAGSASAGTGDGPAADVVADPRERGGHVGGHRGGHDDLLAPRRPGRPAGRGGPRRARRRRHRGSAPGPPRRRAAARRRPAGGPARATTTPRGWRSRGRAARRRAAPARHGAGRPGRRRAPALRAGLLERVPHGRLEIRALPVHPGPAVPRRVRSVPRRRRDAAARTMAGRRSRPARGPRRRPRTPPRRAGAGPGRGTAARPAVPLPPGRAGRPRHPGSPPSTTARDRPPGRWLGGAEDAATRPREVRAPADFSSAVRWRTTRS